MIPLRNPPRTPEKHVGGDLSVAAWGPSELWYTPRGFERRRRVFRVDATRRARRISQRNHPSALGVPCDAPSGFTAISAPEEGFGAKCPSGGSARQCAPRILRPLTVPGD